MPDAFWPVGMLTWMDLQSMAQTPQSLSSKAIQLTLQVYDGKPSTSQSSQMYVKRHEQQQIHEGNWSCSACVCHVCSLSVQ